MREIASRAGRGNISASTVHNIFRTSRVPRWTFLEQVIKALGGGQDREEFLRLWRAAERVENEGVGPGQGPAHAALQSGPTGRQRDGLTSWSAQGVLAGGTEAALRTPQRIWSYEIPPRNLHFTGRAAELSRISENLSSRQPPNVQVIFGMGGIGKTEIATEYVYRNIDRYEIIWWVRAERHDQIRDALVKLAQRLELGQATSDSHDRTITDVLETLQSPARPSWLLVYDDADNLLDLQEYLPACRPGGHILIASRQLNWPGYIVADAIEVPQFTPEEAISYLRQRVVRLALRNSWEQLTEEEDTRRSQEARRLAEGLGHLPIALHHAAANLGESGESVDEYLIRFAGNAHVLLSGQPGDSRFAGYASRTWATSLTTLTPDAEHLFNLCAFFSPEPIAAGLFLQDVTSVDNPPGLAEFLSSQHRFRAAASLLHRTSLVKVDGVRDLIQMHRVLQAAARGQLKQDRLEAFYAYRSAVDALLANSNPGNPDNRANDMAYDLSLQHLVSDPTFLNTDNPALRALIVDQVRRLHLRGMYVEAVHFGQEARRVWGERLGGDNLQLLAVAVEVAVAMYVGGRAADAHELIRQIRPLLQAYSSGDGLKVLLLCENFYAEDLRSRAEFREALELDLSILPKYEMAFGVDNERTLNVRSNTAIDYRHLGQFGDALDTDRRTLEGRRRVLGPRDPVTLYSASAVGRDLRDLGRYQESLDMARWVVNAFEAIGGPEHVHWLNACQQFATALHRAGHYWGALQEREHVLQRYREFLGVDHEYTLCAAAGFINDRLAIGDFAAAEELAHETRNLCREFSRSEDLHCAILLNLGSVLRVSQRPAEALPYDTQARSELRRLYGDLHPFTLSASINYAADLAACGRLGKALQVGHETLNRCRRSLGDNHPDTLMAAANLSMDEAAVGDEIGAGQLLTEVLERYEQTLTLEHPVARAAARRNRLIAEIEPYM
jgi:Tetratricopeptide repeat/NB-ARC domain